MRISKFKVTGSSTKSLNLDDIILTSKPLGSTVALVGKNGAGKSRILSLVKDYIPQLTIDNLLNGYLDRIPADIIGKKQPNIDAVDDLLHKITSPNNTIEDKKQMQERANSLMAPILQNLKRLGPAYVKFVDNDDLKNIKGITNKSNELSFEQILSNQHYHNLINNPPNRQNQIAPLNEFSRFNSQSTIEYFTSLTNKVVIDEFNLYVDNRSAPDIVRKEIEKKDSYQLFRKFQYYISKFLGSDLTYVQEVSGNTVNSTLQFNKRPFNLSLFSPGQKTLFAYAILFFYLDVNSMANIHDSVIIIDEPEKHLHPEAQITLVNALKDIVAESGQLWLATHSVHILSHLEYEEILMVEDNRITPPSRLTPGKSFNSLMGLENHIEKLSTFIRSISDWSYGNFMLQCFKEPDVVFANNPSDPQFKLFRDYIMGQKQAELLDYGAGKGRIGYTINEDNEVSSRVIYSAFDPDVENHSLLSKVPKIDNLYRDPDEIEENHFDCVLLCNVLHEINPKEWINVFTTIRNVLKDGGFLLLIEDKYLPKGEVAHEFGYLILGSDEAQILLGTDKVLELKLEDARFKDRIMFNAFIKEDIEVTKKSVLASLNKLKENSYRNIKEIRKEERSLDQGRRYANQTQLNINAQMAIDALRNWK